MTRFLLLSSALIFSACQATAGDEQGTFDAASVIRGGDIYADLCASCHGESGSASSLFDGEWVHGATHVAIKANIRNGIEDVGMPAFEDGVTDTQLAELLAFIKDGGAAMKTTAPVDRVSSVDRDIEVDIWVDGLEQPWALAFIPEKSGEMLITEKSGALLHFDGSNLRTITGIPDVLVHSQGGLFDVAFDPDFETTGWIYLAFAHPLEPGSKKAMTKIIRGRVEGAQWVDEEDLFVAKSEHYVNSRVHYGGRITFDKDGHLFFSIGDRGKKEQAQDLTRPNGKIHRIYRDGTIPQDNPFVDVEGAYPSIYAYGNRNPQGLVVHPGTNVLWETEHGPKGGDELNAIKPGVNYGWPEISYGRNYNGTELTPHTNKPGMAQPESQWTPSIAVCGLDVYTGDIFPEWKGKLMVGALRHETVRLVSVTGDSYVDEVTLLDGWGRVRDVTTGSDGAIYVALPEKIVRVSPK